MNKVKKFVLDYYIASVKASDLFREKMEVDPFCILTVAALESGWGDHVKGNNFFGIKDFDGINGNEQLISTTEYHKTDKVKYPSITKIVFDKAKGWYKYLVKDYFRKFNTPTDAFVFFLNVIYLSKYPNKLKRYKACFYAATPQQFFEGMKKGGYATDPDYVEKCMKVYRTLKSYDNEPSKLR